VDVLPDDVANTLIVDDCCDSGNTLLPFVEKKYRTAVIHRKTTCPITPTYYAGDSSKWIHYFWEGTALADSITDNVVRQLQFIGEDPNREGLRETPARVARSYAELYSGYKQNPADVFKVFQEGACDEMVILKNVEFCSMCEHHMLPFFGKAHIAYIPDGKVIGVSKLARLFEIYARRLQIQERIGQQVTSALDEFLKPKGSACIIEAQHYCMKGRGIKKQNSMMVTSSLSGVFRSNAETRAEFLSIIK